MFGGMERCRTSLYMDTKCIYLIIEMFAYFILCVFYLSILSFRSDARLWQISALSLMMWFRVL